MVRVEISQQGGGCTVRRGKYLFLHIFKVLVYVPTRVCVHEDDIREGEGGAVGGLPRRRRHGKGTLGAKFQWSLQEENTLLRKSEATQAESIWLV